MYLFYFFVFITISSLIIIHYHPSSLNLLFTFLYLILDPFFTSFLICVFGWVCSGSVMVIFSLMIIYMVMETSSTVDVTGGLIYQLMVLWVTINPAVGLSITASGVYLRTLTGFTSGFEMAGGFSIVSGTSSMTSIVIFNWWIRVECHFDILVNWGVLIESEGCLFIIPKDSVRKKWNDCIGKVYLTV